MSWRDTQSAFAKALRDPVRDVPDAVGPRKQGVPSARFNVYRNNTAFSLTEAMADSYPVISALVGDEFFKAMAGQYVQSNTPKSPVLLHYGETFAEFLETFEPAESLPFLADVARVEWAFVQAYHAADSDSITAEALQAVPAEDVHEACLTLHPSLHLIQSDWPAISIWSIHQIDDLNERQAALRQVEQKGECGLIVRPEFEVNVQLVQPPILQLLTSFSDGATLGEAAERLEPDDVEDFGGMLGYIFSTGAITDIRTVINQE